MEMVLQYYYWYTGNTLHVRGVRSRSMTRLDTVPLRTGKVGRATK